jgi:predicted CopG family antitoxin
MSLFASNFKLLEKGAVKQLDDLVTAPGTFSRITQDGKFVEFVTSDAKVIRFPADDVAKAYRITNPKNGKLFTTGAEWVKYHKAVAKPAVKAAFKDRFLAFFMTRFNKEAAENFSKRLTYFVGKQIYKLIFGSDFIDGKSKWTRDEVEGHGNGAFNDFIRRRIEEEKKKTGAEFVPDIMLDASDKEAFDKITDYQNHFAENMGKPSIMHVVYDKADNSPDAKAFKTFFDKVAAGEIKRGDAGDIVRTQTSTDVRNIEKKKNEGRTVLSFKDFKNV